MPRSILVAAAIALTACGGGDNKSDGDATVPPPIAAAGDLKSAALLNTITPAQITEALAKDASKVQGIVPRYSVTSYRLEYLTSDAQGREVRASGLVSVPVKALGAKSPVLGYQHGTIFTSAEAPSNNAVGSEVAVVMASLGYIVVAPDYVGYGVSKGVAHPYLLSGPTAAATLDMLTAARTGAARAMRPTTASSSSPATPKAATPPWRPTAPCRPARRPSARPCAWWWWGLGPTTCRPRSMAW